MTIADKLDLLYNTKLSIKLSLINKGIDILDNTAFSTYSNFIDSMEINMLDIMFTGQITPYWGSFDETGVHPLVNGEIKTDWRICDGQNGTPDLRDKFIKGSDSINIGTTGGNESSTTSTVTAHTHTGGTIGATTLTESQMPAHTHNVYGGINSGISIKHPVSSGSWESVENTRISQAKIPSETIGGGTSHTHTNAATGASGSHSHTVSILPPYYALCYIMKL